MQPGQEIWDKTKWAAQKLLESLATELLQSPESSWPVGCYCFCSDMKAEGQKLSRSRQKQTKTHKSKQSPSHQDGHAAHASVHDHASGAPPVHARRTCLRIGGADRSVQRGQFWCCFTNSTTLLILKDGRPPLPRQSDEFRPEQTHWAVGMYPCSYCLGLELCCLGLELCAATLRWN